MNGRKLRLPSGRIDIIDDTDAFKENYSMDPQAAGEFGGWQLFTIILWAIVIIIPFWRLNTKAGYSGWLALLMVIPIANILYLYFLAFSNWPSRRDDL